MGLAAWRYMWRISALHRRDEEGGLADTGPELPRELLDERVQLPEHGSGPLFHRLYRVRISGARMSASELLERIRADPNCAVPREVAVFRTRRDRGPLCSGDELVVRMPGPWDGPVRVVEADGDRLRLVTLRGHLEAGQIEFRARPDGGDVIFEIESWARSGDRLADFLYDRIRLAKEMQFHMWTHFCERAARVAGGRVRGGIEITTRRCTWPM